MSRGGNRSMDLGDIRPALKPYDGKEDFTDWQWMMRNVLVQQDLDDALLDARPATTQESLWNKILKKAKSSIEIHLTRSVRSHITEAMTAKEAWEKLESVYMGKTVSNKLFLKDELFGLRLEKGGDVADHICKFQNCLANLTKVEEVYKDDDKAIILLRSLPPSFKHFRTTLMFGKETLKLDDVVQALQSYSKLDDLTDGSQTQGFYAKENERGRSNKKGEKNSNKGRSKSKGKPKEGCFVCGSMDHWKKNCKTWKDRKAKMERDSGSASTVTKEESDGELLSVTSGSLIGLQNAGKTSLVNVIATGGYSKDMISTVGFNMREVTKGNVTIKLWDLGGQPRFRSMWERYCRAVSSIVYVVDAADYDNLSVLRRELHDLLSKPSLNGIPLLVLGNKIDKEEALSKQDLTEQMELKSITDREVCCFMISCKNSTNVDTVIDWLVKHSKSKN